MSAEITSVITLLSLIVAVVLGMQVSEKLLSTDTKETVKLATNLVATMSALVLGLLVSSAKSSYDTVRGEVIDMSAKAVFLDRLLVGYGPESAEARARLRESIDESVKRMWPRESGRAADLAPNVEAGSAVYMTIQNLSPKDEVHRGLKAEATNVSVDLAKLRRLLLAQSVPSISKVMLAVLISWLVIIFFSFSILAPTNLPAITALVVSAVSVCGAIFLILELDSPFGGIMGLSSEPMERALSQLVQAGQ